MIKKLITTIQLLFNPNKVLNIAVATNNLKLARKALLRGAKPTFIHVVVAFNSGDKDLLDTLIQHSSNQQASDGLVLLNSKHGRH